MLAPLVTISAQGRVLVPTPLPAPPPSPLRPSPPPPSALTMPSPPVAALLEASKSAPGRQELLSSGQMAELAQQAAAALPKLDEAGAGGDHHQLLLLLRLLRNSCALGAPAATLLLQHQLPRVVAEAAAGIAASDGERTQRQEQQQLLLPAVQLLHNLSATGPEGAAAVWAALFPATLGSILRSDLGAVHEAVALTCLSCARSHTGQALADLTSSAAATAWQRLLAPLMPEAGQEAAADQSQQQSPTATLPPGNDNLCLLVKCVAMQHNKLQQLMQLLSPQQQRQQQLTKAAFHAVEQHAVLLHVVALEAAAVPAGSDVPGLSLAVDAGGSSCAGGDGSSSSSSWLQYVVQLLQELWAQASAAAALTPGVCSNPTAVAHALEAVLQVLTAVLARDQDAAAGVKPGKESEAAAAAGLAAIAQHLHSLGLLQQLLQMLTALGPPPKTKQQQQCELEEQQQQQGQSQQARQEAAQPPPQHQQLYAGYRADVLAVLSNLLLGGREVQDALMASGGIELLLTNCNLDESSPMAREWALWGIRNACKDNAAVQGYVAQFQAVDAVQSPELDKMGMQLELDQMTHKLKLSKKQQDTQ